MGTRIWWYNPPKPGEDSEPDMAADKWQSMRLSGLMTAYFLEYDESPPEIDEIYFHRKEKWQELNNKLPMEVGPEGFKYPDVCYHVELKRNVADGETTMPQEHFMDLRPVLKRIAEDLRDVYEA